MSHTNMFNTSLAFLRNRFYSKQSTRGQVPLPAILNWIRVGWDKEIHCLSRLVILIYRAFVPNSLILISSHHLCCLYWWKRNIFMKSLLMINTENAASPRISFSLFLNTLESLEGVAQAGLCPILARASLIPVCKEQISFCSVCSIQNFHYVCLNVCSESCVPATRFLLNTRLKN